MPTPEGTSRLPQQRSSQPPPPPKWVKGFGVAAVVLLVLFVILHLAGIAPEGAHG